MKIAMALFGAAMLGAASFGVSSSAYAADLPGSYPVEASGPFCAAYSHPFDRPDVTPAMVQEAVQEHFSLSVEVSERQSTIFNASPRFVWSNETKIYCGMAIGYFAAGELNDVAVTKCDCFYAQMRHYMER
jgi:hypothetical protein